MLNYSIIIPAYNEASFLPKTLDCLKLCISELPEAKGEIIVVDNNSSDETSRVAKDFGARVVFEPRRGISLARNFGARESKGDFLFFVDADTQVPASTFVKAFQLLKHSKTLGGGSILRFDYTHGRLFFGVAIPKLWNLLSRVFKIAAGSFIFCDRKSFELTGGFPENFFAGEEIFFSINMKKICRKQNKRFKILAMIPVTTSSRKLIWFSNVQIISAMLQILIFPHNLKSKKKCKFWYERPT